MASNGITVGEEFDNVLGHYEERGETLVMVSVDGENTLIYFNIQWMFKRCCVII